MMRALLLSVITVTTFAACNDKIDVSKKPDAPVAAVVPAPNAAASPAAAPSATPSTPVAGPAKPGAKPVVHVADWNGSPSDIEELDIDEIPGNYSLGCVNDPVAHKSTKQTILYAREGDQVILSAEKTRFDGLDCDPAKKSQVTSYKAKAILYQEPVDVKVWKSTSSLGGVKKGKDLIITIQARRLKLEVIELNGKAPIGKYIGYASVLPIKVNGRRHLLQVGTISNTFSNSEEAPFGSYQLNGWLYLMNAEISNLVPSTDPADVADAAANKGAHFEQSPTADPTPSPSASPSPSAAPVPAADALPSPDDGILE